jgi:hypothetical protein
MESDLKPVEHALSEDQKAVNEYFASKSYQEPGRRHRRALKPQAFPRAPGDLSGYGLPRYRADDWLDAGLTPAASFVLGLVGLNFILLITACVPPIAIHLMNQMVSPRDGFFMMMAFIQTIMFPPLISFSFATVTPMFWYGRVWIRFAVGILMVLPGCFAFFALITQLEGNQGDDFLFAFSGVMFTQFLVAGTVALLVQMWSPWTLTHQRRARTPLPPLGTLAILELTGVAALGCAVFMWDGFGGILEGILFFAGIGALSSLAVIAVQIAFLRDDRRNLVSAVIGFAAALGMAALMCGFFAIAEFGWASVTQDLPFITMASAYGAVVISAVLWLCVYWLRFCGWRCVNRHLEKARSIPTT